MKTAPKKGRTTRTTRPRREEPVVTTKAKPPAPKVEVKPVEKPKPKTEKSREWGELADEASAADAMPTAWPQGDR